MTEIFSPYQHVGPEEHQDNTNKLLRGLLGEARRSGHTRQQLILNMAERIAVEMTGQPLLPPPLPQTKKR